MTRLRLGVVCAGRRAPLWQATIVRSLLNCPDTELVAIFACQPPPVEGSIWRWYWRRLVLPRARALQPVDLQAEIGDTPVTELAESSMARQPSDLSLDVIVDLAHPAASNLGSATEVPIWSFDHSPAAPGLGEFLRRDATTTVRLIQLRDGLVSILHSGTLPTQRRSYVHQLDMVLLQTADWIVRSGRQRTLGGRVRIPSSGRLQQVERGHSHAITGRETLAVARRVVTTMTTTALRELRRCEDWHVGVVERPIASFLDGGTVADVHWLARSDPNGSLADPFPFCANGQTWLLAEHYGFDDLHGRIVALRGNRTTAFGRPDVVIDDVAHLSYPFLLEHEGAIFCLPERAQARELVLFRALEFPHRWVRAAVLLEDFPALDATIFRHAGRWWLFCTNADSSPAVDLHGFHAERLEGPWQPHRLNPLKTDAATSRCGGTPFREGDKLYRPAQDCSRTYGGALSLNMITELTPDRFSEQVVARVEADPDGPYPEGMHTLSALGDITMVDGKRYISNLRYVKRQLRRLGSTPLRLARTRTVWPSG